MRKALLIVSVAVFGLSFGGGKQAVSTFTDKRDGKVYRIVQIGRQVWFAENLNFAAAGSKENKCDAYYDTSDCAKYGRWYDWATAEKACPVGWHLPSSAEWDTLVDYAGGWKTAGTKLKKPSRDWCWEHCRDVPTGTDEYGFSALAGACGWWSTTERDSSYAWMQLLGGGSPSVRRSVANKTELTSVRCVQDSKEGER